MVRLHEWPDHHGDIPTNIGLTRAGIVEDRWRVARTMGLEVSR